MSPAGRRPAHEGAKPPNADCVVSNAPLLYAFTLGLVAALNPCGFPLLPAYLTGFVGRDADRPWPVRTLRALGSSLAVTVGFVAVFAPLGGLVSAGVDVVLGWVPWTMIPFGVALVGVGLWTLAGRSVKIRVPAVPVRLGDAAGRRRPILGMVLFGVAYAVASLSCALPVFVAGVSGSFHSDGVAGGIAAFVAYALGMGLLLAVAALVVAHAGAPALRRVRRLGPVLHRLVGAVLVLVGGYLVLYWASFLADPSSMPGLVRAVEHVQAILVTSLSSAPRVIGVLLGLGVAGALAAVVASRPSRTPPSPSRAPAAGSPASPGAPSRD